MSAQYSAACERNRDPILAVLREELANCKQVLEIGSGTGQHAVYFAAHLPHLIWHTSDLAENHASILAWQQEARLPNVRPPVVLDVRSDPWPAAPYDAVFTANTCHIMAWEEVEAMFMQVGKLLRATPSDGRFCVYGPFNVGGRYTSAGNAQFDAALRAQAAHMGLRDIEAITQLAESNDMALRQDYEMPANNRLLVWRHAD